jgi:hypothetical protein
MSATAVTREMPAGAQMMQMLAGKWVSSAISIAAELGVADLLAAGDKSVEELATATKSHAPSLYRVLRALASLGIFAETGSRRFTLTPLGQTLRSDSPESVRATARMIRIPIMWSTWGELRHCVETGETAMMKAAGVENPSTTSRIIRRNRRSSIAR